MRAGSPPPLPLGRSPHCVEVGCNARCRNYYYYYYYYYYYHYYYYLFFFIFILFTYIYSIYIFHYSYNICIALFSIFILFIVIISYLFFRSGRHSLPPLLHPQQFQCRLPRSLFPMQPGLQVQRRGLQKFKGLEPHNLGIK